MGRHRQFIVRKRYHCTVKKDSPLYGGKASPLYCRTASSIYCEKASSLYCERASPLYREKLRHSIVGQLRHFIVGQLRHSVVGHAVYHLKSLNSHLAISRSVHMPNSRLTLTLTLREDTACFNHKIIKFLFYFHYFVI